MTQVMNSYQKLYHSPLYKDMSGELQSTEYNEMLAIVNAKPDRIEKKKNLESLLISLKRSYENEVERLVQRENVKLKVNLKIIPCYLYSKARKLP